MIVNHALIDAIFNFIALVGFVIFAIYIACMTFWCNRVYKLIIKADPNFFGNSAKMFLGKFFEQSAMLSIIMSGQYTRINDEVVVKKCNKCRKAILVLFASFFSYVISMIIFQSVLGH